MVIGSHGSHYEGSKKYRRNGRKQKIIPFKNHGHTYLYLLFTYMYIHLKIIDIHIYIYYLHICIYILAIWASLVAQYLPEMQET